MVINNSINYNKNDSLYKLNRENKLYYLVYQCLISHNIKEHIEVIKNYNKITNNNKINLRIFNSHYNDTLMTMTTTVLANYCF
jgi:hypothetical protein